MVEGGATEAAPSAAGALDTAVAGEVESMAGVGLGRRVSVVREPNSTKATAPSSRNGSRKIKQCGDTKRRRQEHISERKRKRD